MKSPPKDLERFEALIEIMAALRSDDGCPWDREQNHHSLVPYAIEEIYELVEALEASDMPHVVEELGDVLFQVVFHSQIATEAGIFSMKDVLKTLNEKMVRRHPHVFGNEKADSAKEVLKNWHQIKKKEKPNATDDFSFDIPEQLPALERANKIGKKTAQSKFDWQTPEQVLLKLDEEIQELKEAMRGGRAKEIEHELGDILFTVAQVGRHLDVNPEQSLRETNRRFEGRYRVMRQLTCERKLNWDVLDDPEKEALWQEAKVLHKKGLAQKK